MADRRTKKTAKQIFGYARLNFHMGMRQGKNLAVLLCMGCFLLYYLGGIRGYLASAEETVSVQELFLAMMNTHYTAMTVWVGYLLVICDIPYSEKGIYPYLIRTSRKSWLLGQILYLFLVTIFYFFYVGLVLAAAIVPHISFRISWTNAFVKMLNAPWRCGIKNYFSFTFSLIKHNSQYVVVVRQTLRTQCFLDLFIFLRQIRLDDSWHVDNGDSYAVEKWPRYIGWRSGSGM